jgi:hypothetical protein
MTLEQQRGSSKILKESIDNLQTQRGCADSMRHRRKGLRQRQNFGSVTSPGVGPEAKDPTE